jgi:Stage II sporulation protein E (SpoIIE)
MFPVARAANSAAEREARVWARGAHNVYLPGFMALLLTKAGEPVSFDITVELLMLSSDAAIGAGLYIGAESSGVRRSFVAVGTGAGPWCRTARRGGLSCVRCRCCSMNWRTETALEPSLPLGIDPDADYSNRDFVLNDDDRLTLCTDGVLGDAQTAQVLPEIDTNVKLSSDLRVSFQAKKTRESGQHDVFE